MSKFTINTKLMVRELAYVQAIIDPIPVSNPILSNVLITANGKHASLIGTNGESGAKTSVILSQPIEETVTIALPAKKLLEMLKLIESDTFTISESEQRITITAGKGRYSFSKVSDAALHIKPLLPINSIVGNSFEVGARQFVTVVNTAGQFTAKDETTKFTLMAIRLDADENGVYGRAMDGHRAVDIGLLDPAKGRNETVIIADNVIDLLGSIVDVSETVKITKADSVLAFESGNRMAVIRRAATENLPNVGQHIDQFIKQNSIKVVVDSKELTNTVKRLQVAVDGKLRRISLTTDTTSLKMHSIALMDQAIEFDEEVAAEVSGAATCNLNASFMLDFLKFVNGPVTFHIGDIKAPVVIVDQTGLRCMFHQIQ